MRVSWTWVCPAFLTLFLLVSCASHLLFKGAKPSRPYALLLECYKAQGWEDVSVSKMLAIQKLRSEFGFPSMQIKIWVFISVLGRLGSMELAGYPAKSVISRFSEKPCLQNILESDWRRHLMVTSDLTSTHTNTHTYAHTQICTHIAHIHAHTKHVYTHVHMHAMHIYTNMYAHIIHTHSYTHCSYTYTHTCPHTNMHTCMHMLYPYTQTCTHILLTHMHIHITHTHVHIHAHTQVCTHIHMHMHTHTLVLCLFIEMVQSSCNCPEVISSRCQKRCHCHLPLQWVKEQWIYRRYWSKSRQCLATVLSLKINSL